ncbi:hypothetical protein MNBD_GAMMA10-257, partial [hydrothermal vent metagenome]
NAFQCAEAGLRAGEIWLSKLSGPAYQVAANPVQGENQVWEANHNDIKNPELGKETLWADAGKTWAYGNVMTNAAASVGCGTEPRYFIEALGSLLPDSENLDYKVQARGRGVMYRITAYSTGIDNTAAVVLQTTYLQPIN